MRPLRSPFAKPVLFAACLAPLGWLAAQAVWGLDGLGANPIEAINRFLGDWALRFLLITLAVTPLSKIKPARSFLSALSDLARMRRMFGLFAFFYASAHLSSYVGLDQFFDFAAIAEDIAKRTYITIGIVTFLLLAPLALTSNNRAIRRLGARRWKTLHRLAYAASILAVIHFAMMIKADFTEPLIYAVLTAALLAARYKATKSASLL